MRIRQLDGLRAVAIACVMAFHFIPGVDRIAPLGSIGVRLFFVLSGFLITRLLLESRALPLGQALRRFYIRRSLRIFPVFYASLAIAAAMNIGPVRQTLAWHLSYLTNAYLYQRGEWHGSISHLWSLAVEEQFYVAWPVVVLLAPLTRLPVIVTAMVCVTPLARLAIGGAMNSVLPISCLDALGAGALIALPQTAAAIAALGRNVGLPLLAVSLITRHIVAKAVWLEVALDLGVALSAAWVVRCAAAGINGSIGRWLLSPPMQYLGAISYGTYLVHGFMPYVLGRYVQGFVDMPWPMRAALLTLSTIVVAATSWHFFEKPLLACKERWTGTLQESIHYERIDLTERAMPVRFRQRADDLEPKLFP